ncbi:hypothetical protein DXV76_16135 [Rhodobacteraceae bacterium CCMM004]|nr:hypothetical protein DXV76_16135 [Rhodobacteraceae bacterium CCMM004]
MTLLILGLILWIGAHMFKRLAPGGRAAMQEKMGDASKGVVAGVLVLSVVLMVLGYRWAEFIPVYDPPMWGVHLNNLGMLIAVGLFGLGSSKSPLRAKMRHPMLTGFALWAAVHLLVNGDLASVILFGALLIWALVEIPLINRAVPDYTPYQGGTTAGTIRLVVITVVVYLVIGLIHGWLGPWPFPQ